MEVSELRIGNLVSIDRNYHIVNSITSKSFIEKSRLDECELVLMCINDNSFFECNSDRIEGITLTEEILLKCGFVKEEDWYRHNVMKKYTIESGVIDLTKGRYHIRQYISKGKSLHLSDLKYLHELQNIYWCLCGKELEISL